METGKMDKESLLTQRLNKIKSMLYEAQELNRRLDTQICVIGGNYPKDNGDKATNEITPESVLDKLDFNIGQLSVLINGLNNNVNRLSDITGA